MIVSQSTSFDQNVFPARTSPSSRSNLGALPSELIEMILDSANADGTLILNGFDLCNLRLTNRRIRLLSFERFANRCFSTRKHMLDRRSLDTLLQIAQHPVFSDYVREVAIGPEHINGDFLDCDCPDHNPRPWNDNRSHDCCPLVVQKFTDLVWEQNCYEDDGTYEYDGEINYPVLVSILGLALQRFRNLENVRLDSYMDIEDDEGRPRAWGARLYYELAADLEQAGYKRVHPSPNEVNISSVAVDDKDFMPPPHILIDRGSDVEGLYRNYIPVLEALHSIREKANWTLEFHYDFALRWPQGQIQDDLLILEPLEVASGGWDSVRHRVHVLKLAAVFKETTEYQERYETWVSELLESCDRIERLIITDNDYQWDALSGAIHSQSLRSITIKRSRIYPADLRELLNNNSASLEELVCEDIHLDPESPFDWIHMLQEIKACPQLARIELSQLYQSEAQQLPLKEEEGINTVITASSVGTVRHQLDLVIQQSVVFGDWQFGWRASTVEEDSLTP